MSQEILPLYLKETATQAFCCKICEIFKNIYFEEHLRMTASAKLTNWIVWIIVGVYKLIYRLIIHYFDFSGESQSRSKEVRKNWSSRLQR